MVGVRSNEVIEKSASLGLEIKFDLMVNFFKKITETHSTTVAPGIFPKA